MSCDLVITSLQLEVRDEVDAAREQQKRKRWHVKWPCVGHQCFFRHGSKRGCGYIGPRHAPEPTEQQPGPPLLPLPPSTI
jgi:hypothetical protein